MKTILSILVGSLLLIGCSVPKNPKVSFGKKCMQKGDTIYYSYAWVYDKQQGLDADQKTCELIKKAEGK